LFVSARQDKNPLGFGNWQRGENENGINSNACFHFRRAKQFGKLLFAHPARRTMDIVYLE
jgi:hypothetical protein